MGGAIPCMQTELVMLPRGTARVARYGAHGSSLRQVTVPWTCYPSPQPSRGVPGCLPFPFTPGICGDMAHKVCSPPACPELLGPCSRWRSPSRVTHLSSATVAR